MEGDSESPRHEEKEKQIRCLYCPYSSENLHDLQSHLEEHPEKREYICSFCSKTFPSKARLTKHLRIHTGDKPFSCTKCGRTFNQNSNMQKHEKNHDNIEPLCCKFCGKVCTGPFRLFQHERVHKSKTIPTVTTRTPTQQPSSWTSCPDTERVRLPSFHDAFNSIVSRIRFGYIKFYE